MLAAASQDGEAGRKDVQTVRKRGRSAVIPQLPRTVPACSIRHAQSKTPMSVLISPISRRIFHFTAKSLPVNSFLLLFIEQTFVTDTELG